METNNKKPYVIYMAEIIYLHISTIKRENTDLGTKEAIDKFMLTNEFTKLSTGELHDNWFKELKKNSLVDKKTKKKIPDETIKLLQLQKDFMMKQLIQFPDLYYTKSHFPLEISQRAFNHLWRMCESYELWCKETKQIELIILKLID